MINLIQADLYKLRKSTTIKILFIVTSLCAIIMTTFAYLIPQGKISESYTGLGFLFSDVNIMSILGAAVAGIFICGDFDNRTIHDAIASGCSRIAIICSKAITFFVAIILLLLPYGIVTAISLFSGANFGMNSVGVGFLHMLALDSQTVLDLPVLFKMIAVTLTLILTYVAQLSLCVPLALLCKKPVIVIVIYYAFTIFTAQLYNLKNISQVLKKLASYTPYAGNHIFLTLDSQANNFAKTIIVCLVFIVVMITITYSIFRKSEVK